MKLRKITPRTPNFRFSKNTPRHWMPGSPFKTHLLNSFTLIFPTGEKFFIRNIKKHMKKLNDPHLKWAAQNFIKQETQHYFEHEKFFDVLKAQGYSFEKEIKKFEKLIKNVLEKINGDELNLAVTAGLEHITSLLAEISLSENFLQGAPTELKDLFDWHAAEEIEHRAVAFDVYNKAYGNYTLRVIGLLVAYAILGSSSLFFTAYLLKQDEKLFDRTTMADFVSTFFTKEKLFFKAANIFIRYLHPEFHPDGQDIDALADSIFAKTSIYAQANA